MDLNLKDRVVMVSAASRGLGYEIARQASIEGAKVSIGSSSEEKITQAAELIQGETGNVVLATPMDVTDYDSIKSWYKNTIDQLGTVHKLVVNTGGPKPGKFDDFSDEDWHDAYHLVLMSAVRLIREALPFMKDHQNGSILTMTSLSVKEPIENLLFSNVMRSGVTSLVKTLSSELADQGIRINNIVPGIINTSRVENLIEHNAAQAQKTSKDVREAMLNKIPMNRFGTTEEFAKMALFLLSDVSSYITGQTFVVDGGKSKTVW